VTFEYVMLDGVNDSDRHAKALIRLLEALRAYPKLSNSERITFEYVMLDGVNDSDADARRLIELIRGIPAKINLIPFNEWPGAPYRRSSNNRIRAFADIIYKAGYASPIRTPRGEDIMAACGQLKSESARAARVRRPAAGPAEGAASSAG
jgi:23S rRNA (adenine2503-C2)-methyltransferase